MGLRSPRSDLFRSSLFPTLALPIGTAQPSLVLLSVTASFILAFCLTFCFVGHAPKSQQPLPTPPAISFLHLN
jgi:hypothetical protein